MNSVAVLGLAGGFAHGVLSGGGYIREAYENGFGQELFELNLPGVVYRDVTEPRLRGGVDLQFGCPPCAGWSAASAGFAQRNNPGHPINDGIRWWFQHVEASRPAMACYESVPGHLKEGRGLWGPLARRLEDLGYRWCFITYDNQDHGVPQRRVRVTFWCWRNGGNLEPAVPLRGQDVLTVSQAFDRPWWTDDEDPPGWAQLPMRPENAVHRVLPYVEAGSNARKIPTEIWLEFYHQEGVRDGWPSFTFRRLHPDRPAPVMLANALEATVHYDDVGYPRGSDGEWVPNPACRLLTGRELAILMGYPDFFQLRYRDSLRATPGEARQLSAWLTQAVSPAVGMWVARVASVHLETEFGAGDGWEPGVWDLRRGAYRWDPLADWAA